MDDTFTQIPNSPIAYEIMKPNIQKALLSPMVEKPETVRSKITIIGAGHVGMAIAINLLAQNISNELCLIDLCQEKVIGEMLDLQQAANYLKNPNITAGIDYSISANSHICIITSKVKMDRGEPYIEYVQRNVDVMKRIVPKIVKYNPETIVLVAPCSPLVDILSYVVWKLSGFPKNRVFGTGTCLDSSRFRYLLSQRLNVATSCVQGWIIGEQGDNSIPVWSGVSISGVRLRELNPFIGSVDDGEKWNDMHKNIIRTGNKAIRLKGNLAWSSGLCVAKLVGAIVKSRSNVHAVSTAVIGEHSIEKEVFLSLPCVLTSAGVTKIIKQVLTPAESKMLHASVKRQADLLAVLDLKELILV